MTGARFLRLLSLCVFCAAAASVSFAQEIPTPSQNTEDAVLRESLANRYIHDVLPYWQKRLALGDWTIYVLMARPTDLRDKTLGNIHWDMDKKTATIHVMDASAYDMTLIPMLKDMEFTIVHELIHLELASLPRSDASRSEEEFAINHIADALLKSSSESRPALPR